MRTKKRERDFSDKNVAPLEIHLKKQNGQKQNHTLKVWSKENPQAKKHVVVEQSIIQMMHSPAEL